MTESVGGTRSGGVPLGRVCVLGTGLIGGSVLRRLGPETAFGWNRSAATADAAGRDGYEVSTDLPAVLRRATACDALLVVGVPMPAVGSVLDAVAEHAPGAALTDVVSVAGPVLREVRARGLGARFVGGHPMAGTAESGWAATDPELFAGATWVVAVDGSPTGSAEGSPDDGHGPDAEVWERVARLATACGSHVVAASSPEHDAAVARVSHLPHVLAEALATTGAAGGALPLALAAGSFRDGTRVAATAPDLVRAICEPNRDALVAAIDECLGHLGAARAALSTDGSLAALVGGGHAARGLFDDRSAGAAETVEPGRDGWALRALAAGRAGRAVTLPD